ncbi:MAG: hypothetical protein Q7R89_01085, partial [bacterium]|nr:hypothetical protein [bacterium]
MEKFENINDKTNTETILKGVLNKVENPTLLNDLEKMSGEDLQALLISVYDKRAKNLEPKDILRQAKENRFLKPSPVSLRDFNLFDSS